MDRKKTGDKASFEIEDRGFKVQAWYLEDTAQSKGDAIIEIERDGKPLRSFLYPAYRIYNIAAHFSDIVDGELANHDGGYRAANWNGITNPGAPQPLKQPD